MEKVIISIYAISTTFSIVAIIFLIVRRRRLKKKETFENREN